MPERYSEFYSQTEIQDHARAVQRLSPDAPVAIAEFGYEADRETGIHFTVCTYDAPGLFSYLTGILGSFRFNIQSGHIFTSSSGIAIDTFRGFLPSEAEIDAWIVSLERTLTEILVP
ncbi:MAG: hypothetical protein ACOCU4_08095, partial [Alkalispirochaeta sp.]